MNVLTIGNPSKLHRVYFSLVKGLGNLIIIRFDCLTTESVFVFVTAAETWLHHEQQHHASHRQTGTVWDQGPLVLLPAHCQDPVRRSVSINPESNLSPLMTAVHQDEIIRSCVLKFRVSFCPQTLWQPTGTKSAHKTSWTSSVCSSE